LLVIGEEVRDWRASNTRWVFYPYTGASRDLARMEFWSLRVILRERATFQGVMVDAGLDWLDYMQHTAASYVTPLSIVFAFVSTHNHFVLDRGGKVFNRTAPVIKLPAVASQDDHLGLIGLLNSSTACFWMKQVFQNRGAGGGTRVASGNSPLGDEAWESHFEFTGTGLQRFPTVPSRPLDLARDLDAEAQRLSDNLPSAVCKRAVPTRDVLGSAYTAVESARAKMISLQE
jgi:hypothetical protein